MFFRFAAGLFLVVLVSMVGVGLEKQTLEMKRALSRQYYHQDLLLEMHAGLRLRIQQLTAPSQLASDQMEGDSGLPGGFYSSRNASPEPEGQPGTNRMITETQGNSDSIKPDPPVPAGLPLLRWEHPARASQ